jgi:prevent-host-death family protein
MIFSESIKPISYVKSNMALVIQQLNENKSAIIITQNGEAKAALVDIKEYEQTQETIAMLKLIAQGKRNIAEGKFRPVKNAFRDLGARIEKDIE